jgi:hypothetical protein
VLACKHARAAPGDMLLFRWSVEDHELTEPLWRSVPRATLAPPTGAGAFRPSGLARDPQSGHWLVLSASPAAVAELTPDGELLGVRWLDEARHRQPEGITVSPSALWIADEARGKRARLAAYPFGEENP